MSLENAEDPSGNNDAEPATAVSAGSFLPGEQVTRFEAARGVTMESAGQRLGNCTLLEPVGEGGFGTVWKALQEGPLRRIVAVKIIKPGMDSQEVVARFARERQALALMEHPGIATIYDAGTTKTGRPYFVMEFVDGVPLTRFCDERRLDAKARLQVMLDVCSAVQHAHQKGIIHRDLKPHNILAGGSADKPRAVVIDFGVARALDHDHLPTGETIHTGYQQFIGTPAYMSPEQASPGVMDIDTRSDIYSLGVLLYQLLTGTTPFASKTAGATLEEVRRIVRDETPPAPSTALNRLKGEALSTVMTARNTALNTLNRLLRRDLDWIVIRALEKDRDRRYQTVAALAADIRRYLAGEPVVARPPDFRYRAGKFLRKHRRPAFAAGAILLTLSGGLAASTTMMLREKEAVRRESAERENVDREIAKVVTESNTNEQTAIFLSELLSGINPDVAKGADQKLMKKILAKAVDRIGTGLRGQPQMEAYLRNTIGSTYFTMGLSPEARDQFEAGLKVAAGALGPANRVTLRLRGNLANLNADLQKAEAENRAILEIRRNAYPPNDRETLATMENLANALAEQGAAGAPEKFKAAAEEYAEVIKLQTAAFGDKDPDTLHSRLALANTKREMRQNVVEEYRQIVALMEENTNELGADHPDTLAARYGLADALLAAGDLDAALSEHQAVFEKREKVLSGTHKKTLRSHYMTGNILLRQKKPDEAAAIFRKVLVQQETEAKKGRVRPDEVLSTRIGLASAAGAMGDPGEAEIQFKAIITGMEAMGSKPTNPKLLTTRNNLALALKDQKRFSEAEDELRKVFDARQRTLSKGDPDLIDAIRNLSAILRLQNNTQEALKLESRIDKTGN